jgi:hypothetical protein
VTVALTSNFFSNARGLTLLDGGGITWSINKNTNAISASGSGAGASGANPTGKVGLAVVNGSAATFLRSDGAPPIDQTITPTWTGLHTFTGGMTVSGTVKFDTYTFVLTGNASVSGTNTGDQTLPVGANPSASLGLAAVNGSATSFMRSDGAPALSQAIAPTWTGTHTFNLAPVFKVAPQTLNGSTSVPNNTATTLVAVPSVALATYLVCAGVSASGGDYAIAILNVSESAGNLTVLAHNSSFTVSMSGLNLQCTHTIGSTQTVSYNLILIQ